MNSELLFNQARELMKENQSLCNSEEAWNIAHALEILIEANRFEKTLTPLKINIIKAMASCNYKIGNFNYAYNCAMIAKEQIDEYIINGSPFDGDTTRKMMGNDECNEIIEAIKRRGESTTRLLDDHVLSTFCTINLRKVFPPKNESSFTRDELYHLIHAIEQTKKYVASQAYSHGDYQFAEQLERIYNVYKYPLYYIWQKYRYGRDEEVWVEDENMMPYHIFVSNISQNIDELIATLYGNNPFVPLSNGPAIITMLKKILGDLQMRLKKGRI